MNPLLERISINPAVCGGKPCIKGTRIWVSLILDFLAGGETETELLAKYPQLGHDDIRAAIAYGAEAAREFVPSVLTSSAIHDSVCSVIVGDGEFKFPIVGESHYQAALEKIAGKRSEEGTDLQCCAVLTAEPDNPYDKNAVAILIGGTKVGYLSRDVAGDFRSALEHAGVGRAACAAVIVGGWKRGSDVGYFGVRLNARMPFKLQGAMSETEALKQAAN